MFEGEYRVLSHVEHVLERPSQYVGSVVTRKVTDWIFDQPTQKMQHKETIYNEGLVKTIFEVIDNAVDNSKKKFNPTTTIKVSMDDTTIIVTNDGAGIPVKEADLGNGKKMYIPTTIFGVPMSGSNFNENRNGTIGMNGLGVKLTNILSKEFKVICIDGDKKFKQVWKNNMKDRMKESVTKAPSKLQFTTSVTFTPDLSYFHNDDNECNITSLLQISDIIYTRLLTISVSHPNPIKIYFNGKQIKCKGIKAYMKLFTDDRTFYESIPNENFEYGVTLSTTGSFEHQSFVNCQRTTSDKSSHTKYVTNQVVSAITQYFKKKGAGNTKLSNNYIANYLHVFVNIQLMNPKFTSQTKVELASNIPPKKYPIDTSKVLGLIKKSGLLTRLESALDSKVLNTVQNSLNASTKKSTINIPKLDDAHDAGTVKSSDTMLFLVEGDSAKTMVSTGMSIIGRKKYGVFPLKGKVLNVIGAAPKKLAGNKEIANIMKILGLNFNKKYNTVEERKTLRYGRLCILTDADVDGMHITGLLITFIHHFWPSLLESGFLKRFVTPIIKITKGKASHSFFTLSDYLEFEDHNNMSGWHAKHLKGLGTSKREENLEYFRNMEQRHLKDFKMDGQTTDLIKHIFDPEESNWRKGWLVNPLSVSRMDYNQKVMDISQFLMTEMYDYSSYNIKRAIPSVIDGFKVSQRKVMCACLDKFKNSSTPSFKVAQLAAFAAAHTNYAHGEVSLQNTIVNMAQSFSGSNNIPYLYEDGAFGTRIANGGDAASPRYIFTKITDKARNIITETSPDVLQYITEENMTVEPEFYVPVLPMVLINGANGIATGFRSLVPLFNPSDIIKNINAKFNRGSSVKLVPWYSGTYKTNHKTREEKNQWVFEGQIDKGPSNTLIITELPIGVAIDDYKDNVLSKMVENGTISRFVVDHVSENEPKFIVYGYKDVNSTVLYDTFKLRNTMTQKCINLLDRNGHVVNFKTPEEIFDYWFDIRTEYVKKSHNNKCKEMEANMVEIQHKLNFIKAVVKNQLELRNVTRNQVIDGMTSLGIPSDLHQKFLQVPLVSVTQERYSALTNELENFKEKFENYSKKTVCDIVMEEIAMFDDNKSSLKRSREENITSNKKSKQ
jgi:DNA topoisomerase-2